MTSGRGQTEEIHGPAGGEPSTRTGNMTETMTVQFKTVDGTAAAPADYSTASGSRSFAPGDTTKTIVVTINADAAPEPSETFTVKLSAATNGRVGRPTGTATIADDD